MKIATPLKNVTPSFPTTTIWKLRSCQPPPPIHFENFNPTLQWKGEQGEHYVIVRNYFCNVLFKVLIKIESTVNTPADFIVPVLWLDYEKQPPEVFYKKAVLENFAISTGNICIRVSFLKSCRFECLQLY